MRKLIYGVPALLLCLAACGGASSKVDDSLSDTAVVANDTVAADSNTATVEAVNDSSNVQNEEVASSPVVPTEALTMKVTSKNLGFAGESSAMSGSWTVTVTNNSDADVKGSDYVIAYSETVEVTKNGEFVEQKKSRTAPGKDVAPGESVTIKLKASNGCMGFSNPKIKNV